MRKGFFTDGGQWVKSVGIAVIVILAVSRFVVYPLHAAIEDRKGMLADQRQTYLLKSRLLAQARQERKERPAKGQAPSGESLYPREARLADVQADLLESLSKSAEGLGLSVAGFEMPEATAGEAVSEIPVVLKLTGETVAFVNWLRGVRASRKVLAVKTLEISASGKTTSFVATVSAFRRER